MKDSKDLVTLPFKSKKDWQKWLERNHDREPGIWLKLAKKTSGIPSVTYMEAVDIALCYGWIDGQNKGIDDDFYVQRFTPRSAKSNWTATNCRKAEEFIAQGKMKPAGLRAVEAAKSGGRWID